MFGTPLKKLSVIAAAGSYFLAIYFMACTDLSVSQLTPIMIIFQVSFWACIVLNIGDFIGWIGRKLRGE